MNLSFSKKSLLKMTFSLLLVFSLLIGSIANAASFNDVSNTHWANQQIQEWSAKGLIKGYEDGSFKPNGTITRAEFMTLVNGGFGFETEQAISFSEVKSGAWYESAVKKAIAAGYVSGYSDGTIRPTNQISRQEVAVILSKLLKLSGNADAAAVFSDDIPEWSKGAIGAVVARGLMKGYKDGSFGASKPITRAEAVVVLDRAVKSLADAEATASGWTIDKAGTYGPAEGNQAVEGNVSITVTGVTLQNITISGDLYIAKSVGEGDAFLKGVTVKGDTYINGGGENSIHIDNSIFVKVTVNKETGKVRIVINGASQIQTITIDSNTLLVLDNKVALEQAILNAIAEVIGEGNVKNAVINVSGVKFDKAPLNYSLGNGATAPILKQQPTPIYYSGPSDTTAPILKSEIPSVFLGGLVWGTSNEAGSLYLVPKGTSASKAALEAALTNFEGTTATSVANVAAKINTVELTPGTYIVYAVDASGNVSAPSEDFEIIEVTDGYESIETANQLAAIGTDATTLGKNYFLTADIDLSANSNWNPIGNDSSAFTGMFIGNGYQISGLTIDREDEDYQGLFGFTESSALLYNVRLNDVSVIGDDYVGGLVGKHAGSIEYSYVTGDIRGDYAIGGLVGYNNGWISSSNSSAKVFGEESAGGLVGANYEEIINSYASGVITGVDYIGGLAGDNYGLIDNSYATGAVTGSYDVGGLVGYGSEAEILNSYALGNVTSDDDYVGGLVGYMSDTLISNSYAEGNVIGIDNVGGLVGQSDGGVITYSHAKGNVVGYNSVGGLVGSNYGAISNSSSSGTVEGHADIGGLVGYHSGVIEDSTASGNVTGYHNVGELVGYNDGTIENSSGSGTATLIDDPDHVDLT
ncbi:MAG: S-layer homology domain-containing protein [Candidatus Cohnella colombiensis]|uniref:S-layer homology domain-containing protein n=1 Tax=Candidatus Cohnella colombiensis TaxID=3121368 RepID=A0AA95EUW3_9BACL|nr:MAG: S-layer homology domain-containing protein [Cohnella sp.]